MIYAFSSAFILSAVCIYIVRHYAASWRLIDIPNERSQHISHIPRSAGIGFVSASLFTTILFYRELFLSYPFVFIALLMVFFIGIYDDRYETYPRAKFIVLIIASGLLYFNGLYINDIGICCGVQISSLWWFALPFTIFSVVGFTNALNLIDGLDGLAGMISIVILSTLFAVGYMHDDQLMMVLSGVFIASLIAFLFFNWNPASIFMGDSGSLTLGFVISLLSIKSLAYLSAVSVLYIAAIPLLDTFVVMIRRKKSGKSLFEADKCHLHHVLHTFFQNRTKLTVIFLVILQVVYSLVGIQMHRGVDGALPLVIFVLNTTLVYLLISTMIKRQGKICS
jgi:UDP-GlcNAc:undecaprenyl-phosphate GlcNAc-1-phosphate transferase